jgi:hypothetical protein
VGVICIALATLPVHGRCHVDSEAGHPKSLVESTSADALISQLAVILTWGR